MFYKMIENKCTQWYESERCTVKNLIEYIEKTGQMRDAQIEAIKVYLFLKIACECKPLTQLFRQGFFNSIDLNEIELSKSTREYLFQNPAAAALFEYACLTNDNGEQVSEKLERTSDMRCIIDSTKTSAGTRKLPITQDVANMFRAIIEDREAPKYEKIIDGYSGFLFVDKNGNPLVAMHWQHRLNHMVKRYNDIYRVQMPNITPHVCRHTYCSNMAKSGMNPKTLQYLMGHSDIAVTLNVYTHIGLDDATEELRKLEEMENARRELEKGQEKPVSQKIFKAI